MDTSVRPHVVLQLERTSFEAIAAAGGRVSGGRLVDGLQGEAAYLTATAAEFVVLPFRSASWLRCGAVDSWVRVPTAIPAGGGAVILEAVAGESRVTVSLEAYTPDGSVMVLRARFTPAGAAQPLELAARVRFRSSEWRHLAVSWDGLDGTNRADLRCYLDGEEVGRRVGGSFCLQASPESVVIGMSTLVSPEPRVPVIIGTLRLWDRPVFPGPQIADVALAAQGRQSPPAAAWQGNTLGVSDEVPPPWTPVERDGLAVGVWGRTYRLAEAGPFPLQVTAAGADLLSRPIEFTVDCDGRRVQWSPGSARFVRVTPAIVTRESELQSSRMVLRTRTSVEFDGMFRVDLTLVPQGAVQIDRLVLEVPLRKDSATYLNAPAWNLNDFSPPWEGLGQTFSGAVPAEGWSAPFYPLLWLGAEERGLCWFTESNEHWRNAEPQKALQIIPQADEVIFRATIVDRPWVIREPLSLTFGLQATPVKPLPANWRAWRTVDAVHGFQPDGRPALTPDVPIAADGRTLALMWTHLGEWKYFGFPEPKDDDARASLGRTIREARRQGMNTLPYWQSTSLSQGVPEWGYYRYDWTVYGVADTVSADVVGMGYPLVAACSASPQWQEFIIHWIVTSFESLGESGWYQDGFVAHACRNLRHGCGYLDAGGRIRETLPIFARREQMKRLYTAIKQRDPNAIIVGHVSHMIQIPVLAFADAYLDGEAAHAPFITVRGKAPPPWDGDYRKRLPPDVLQAQYRGRPFGLVPIFLPALGRTADSPEAEAVFIDQTERLCALLFLHDIPTMWGFRAHAPTVYKYWEAMDRFGLAGVECLPYWGNGGRIRTSHPDVRVTVYRKLGKALVIVANTGDAVAQTEVSLDGEALGLLPRQGRLSDAVSREELAQQGGRLVLSLAPGRLRLILWE
jgi:hypothetical protein